MTELFLMFLLSLMHAVEQFLEAHTSKACTRCEFSQVPIKTGDCFYLRRHSILFQSLPISAGHCIFLLFRWRIIELACDLSEAKNLAIFRSITSYC